MCAPTRARVRGLHRAVSSCESDLEITFCTIGGQPILGDFFARATTSIRDIDVGELNLNSFYRCLLFFDFAPRGVALELCHSKKGE